MDVTIVLTYVLEACWKVVTDELRKQFLELLEESFSRFVGIGNQNQTRQYNLSVESENTKQGTVTGGGTFTEGSIVTVKATPKAGYLFDKWSDGNTSASRNITVSEDMSLTASFKAAEPSGGSGDEGDTY